MRPTSLHTRYVRHPGNGNLRARSSGSNRITGSIKFDGHIETPKGKTPASGAFKFNGNLQTHGPLQASGPTAPPPSGGGGGAPTTHSDLTYRIDSVSKELYCPICNKALRSKPNAKKHVEQVHWKYLGWPRSDFKYKCGEPGCGASFPKQTEIKEHYRRVHGKAYRPDVQKKSGGSDEQGTSDLKDRKGSAGSSNGRRKR